MRLTMCRVAVCPFYSNVLRASAGGILAARIAGLAVADNEMMNASRLTMSSLSHGTTNTP